jgi:hypothetical protein
MSLSLYPSATQYRRPRGSRAEDLLETSPAMRFAVRTEDCDSLRASVHVSGFVAPDAAALLQQVLDDHQRAGRRFVRLDVRKVKTLCPEAIAVVRRAHDALLARRGTLILTGVDARVGEMLRRGDPDGRLLLLAPTADQLS